MSKTILITGGFGFQGTHLTKALLERGDKVYVINTPSKHAVRNRDWLGKQLTKEQSDNLEYVWTSITDTQCLERIVPKCDVIFHLAAKVNVDESIERPDVFYETNIKGTYNILNLAVDNDNTRVIMASTCEVYGGGDTLDENSNLQPKSPYGASKAAADRIAYAYNSTYKLPVDIVRPFNVYGPLQKEEGRGAVIAMFFKKVLNGETLTIHGDGTQGRDFIYVSDVVRGYLNILDRENTDEAKVWTFGTGINTSVNELTAMIIDITKASVPIKFVEGRRGQIDHFIAKHSVNDYFGGNEPMVTFREGLEKYYKFRWDDDFRRTYEEK